MAKRVPQPIQPGNIDTSKIAPVKNPDGTVSTVRSISVSTDSGEVLIPTVVDGRIVSNADAVKEYRATRRHLGIFKTPQDADAFAQDLHQREAKRVAKIRQPR